MTNEIVTTFLNDFFNFSPVVYSNYGMFLDEDDKTYYFTIELPGVKKEDLKIEVNKNILNLKAEAKVRSNSRTYSKSFEVPNNIDTDAIEADLNDGVLLLKMPKTEENRVKLVKIK